MNEKELTKESIEYIVGIKVHIRFLEAKMNKDLVQTEKTVLLGFYQLLQLESYSKEHLRKVIYSNSFEHKGIKY